MVALEGGLFLMSEVPLYGTHKTVQALASRQKSLHPLKGFPLRRKRLSTRTAGPDAAMAAGLVTSLAGGGGLGSRALSLSHMHTHTLARSRALSRWNLKPWTRRGDGGGGDRNLFDSRGS